MYLNVKFGCDRNSTVDFSPEGGQFICHTLFASCFSEINTAEDFITCVSYGCYDVNVILVHFFARNLFGF